MSTTKNPTGLDQRRIRQAFMGEVERLHAQLAAARVTEKPSSTREDETDPADIADADSDAGAVRAGNTLAVLEQTKHAIKRLDAGLYGVCERCENMIGGKRLAAYPRATRCLSCAQGRRKTIA